MRVEFGKGARAVAMKQGAHASSFGPKGWRETALVLSVLVSSAFSAPGLVYRI